MRQDISETGVKHVHGETRRAGDVPLGMREQQEGRIDFFNVLPISYKTCIKSRIKTHMI